MVLLVVVLAAFVAYVLVWLFELVRHRHEPEPLADWAYGINPGDRP